MSAGDAGKRRRGGVVHLVAPASLADPAQPSGGNVYDRELAAALRASGLEVREHLVSCAWSAAGRPVGGALGATLAALPDGAPVLVDGLVGLRAPGALERQRGRLRVWLLVHLPLALFPDRAPTAGEQERRALACVTGVVVTSEWTRRWLVAAYGLEARRVHVARPGVLLGTPSSGDAGALVCVGAVVPAKGQDVLVRALAEVRDLPWSCRIIGPLDRAPAFVGRVRRQVGASGSGDRVTFTGAVSREAVAAALGDGGLLVLPSRLETYGMVVTEALARGVPVLASDVGGVAEAVGCAPGGRVPGVLVPAGDAAALGAEIRRWLTDVVWRRRLRAAARERRASLPAWSATAAVVRSAIGCPSQPAAGQGVGR